MAAFSAVVGAQHGRVAVATPVGRAAGRPSQPTALQRLSSSARMPVRCMSKPNEDAGGVPIGRRQQLALAAALLVARFNSPTPAAAAEVQTSFKTLKDDTLAYEFQYPVETVEGKKLSMSFSRKPEKYSSAAPLSADARQRIVAEVLDLVKAVTVSVTVGPAAGALKKGTPEEWVAETVAQTVLIDRSTARVTTGQRVALNSIEESHKEERDGKPYFVFEHVSQGPPNLSTGRLESFRHALAVTSVRPGMDGTPYLYTLNLACPDDDWDQLEPYFKQAVDSFKLTETTRAYVPPDKDPWLFF